ncbi:hypothetical protein PLESTF_000031800 [Pleodorina starrii]|nr:hypothetical protein PLESTM_000793400 [Pleodorina starrii]GLC63395.1 hypothetical protein PLESTF_000031800 [Pleodorina starrii]
MGRRYVSYSRKALVRTGEDWVIRPAMDGAAIGDIQQHSACQNRQDAELAGQLWFVRGPFYANARFGAPPLPRARLPPTARVTWFRHHTVTCIRRQPPLLRFDMLYTSNSNAHAHDEPS